LASSDGLYADGPWGNNIECTSFDETFLNDIEDTLPPGLDVELVMDNYGNHKVSKVRAWLARHPRSMSNSRRSAEAG
jgi:hypothetical protein